MLGPDPLHAGVANTHCLGHRAKAPVACVRRLLPHGLRQHQRSHLGAQGAFAGSTVPIPQQPVNSFLEEALLPAPDRRLALAHLAHDCHRPNPISRQKHDPRTPDMLLRRIPVRNQPLQSPPVARAQPNTCVRSHQCRIAGISSLGNLLNGAEH